MKIQNTPPLHLTYCLNVHPGETWKEDFAAIKNHTLAVRDRVSDGRPFGLGLRLSAEASEQLARPETLAAFQAFLHKENCYVFTINGFPYGRFHETAVKANVYAPDWRTTERRDYTLTLADILAALLPVGMPGSISTVPCSYKPWIRNEADVAQMVAMLGDVAAHLAAIHRNTGKHITLALESEPDCYLETTDEIIAFFDGPLRVVGREHLGVCLDTSHVAVEFESPVEAMDTLQSAGIPVPKVHISAALQVSPTRAAMERLEQFCDSIYLHQTKARFSGGRIASFADLPAALASNEATAAEEWRVHFHVPLFFGGDGVLQSTRSLLTGRFADMLRAGVAEHLEIETYTFGVLPPDMAVENVTDGIVAEYAWTLGELLEE